ncbi:NADPH cytochrome P450 oxidoreductase family protein [Alteromonas sp. 1_MG-2023]|uniref:NADPH cytochrome P450 oxidoreductase family protein n=1 Tax=Alteromonas sp. 1_MG-2023 TaxID=3062669 RepID=UPI0026E376D5|nr:NADPH cytochrome P450 oxidoreductase family protein [Alteromonas sp. 1_MG-2023]MDO6568026.1 NADPH cytochrome P450 oxidoreductase family protein [Alteromonas sp. 1_MG-2023]
MTETHRLLIALSSITLYVLWVAVIFYRNKKKRSASDSLTSANSTHTKNQTLIVYASQTGTAEKIARAKAAALAKSEAITLVSMASLNLAMLGNVSKALFVVSTYGEGEPPDAGTRFYHALQRAKKSGATPLSNLSFEVIGLGSREYKQFCRFAVSLYENVSLLGGTPLASLTTLDSGKGEHLVHLDSLANDSTEQIQPWVLEHRKQLNQDDTRGLYAITLKQPPLVRETGTVPITWEAGDIIDIYPDLAHGKLSSKELSSEPSKELVGRSYTIASAPQEGDLKLVVREIRKAKGELGYGSGFLTHKLLQKQAVYAQIRKNSNAVITDTQCPLVLIAAGSGIAGVRAQLAKRAMLKESGPVWLFYGERDPELDNVLSKALSPFHNAPCIHKISTIFSKSSLDSATASRKYVQHLIVEQAEALKAFLGSSSGKAPKSGKASNSGKAPKSGKASNSGKAPNSSKSISSDASPYTGRDGQIYVCGNFDGMGKGVDAALRDVLGEEQYATLIEKRRYHRDLY